MISRNENKLRVSSFEVWSVARSIQLYHVKFDPAINNDIDTLDLSK
jgi:hypothetical protein